MAQPRLAKGLISCKDCRDPVIWIRKCVVIIATASSDRRAHTGQHGGIGMVRVLQNLIRNRKIGVQCRRLALYPQAGMRTRVHMTRVAGM